MGLRRAPFAFTGHGALMAATVLNSPRAVEMSLYVVRTFMRMREVLATHTALANQLALLEQQTAAGAVYTLLRDPFARPLCPLKGRRPWTIVEPHPPKVFRELCLKLCGQRHLFTQSNLPHRRPLRVEPNGVR